MSRSPSSIRRLGRLLALLWRGVDGARRLTLNLAFLLVAVVLLAALLASGDPAMPPRCALVVAPQGRIVESLSHEAPALLLLREGTDSQQRDEVLLRDILQALDLVRLDDRVPAVLLDLDQLAGAELSKLQEVGQALDRCRRSGKLVIAYGDHYTQTQYYLAAHADEIYLHPLGGVVLEGLAAYRTYFRTALDKLQVSVHAFHAGTYKSALEPLLRDDMSPTDRQATAAWLEPLWAMYCADVAAQRGLPAAAVHDYAAELPARASRAGGDLAQLAFAQGLVDSVQDRHALQQRLGGLVGSSTDGFNQVSMERYLQAVRDAASLGPPAAPRVGVIVGRGVIVHGRQRTGEIGSETLVEQLRQAQRDPRVHAVVLRLDTGGGSAFGAEVIRREVQRTRQAGKPVVASMSSVAASGGYWVAAAADQIWASPSTLTGSIGVFSAVATFDQSLASLGVHADGLGTTPMAGALDATRPLAPALQRLLQLLVDRTYERFLEVVASGRDLPRHQVEAAAQGRVWAGVRALELGLVDSLGNLDGAVRGAAALADLDTFRVEYLRPKLSPREQLLLWLAGLQAQLLPRPPAWLDHLHDASSQLAIILRRGDPQGVYAWCPGCVSPP